MICKHEGCAIYGRCRVEYGNHLPPRASGTVKSAGNIRVIKLPLIEDVFKFVNDQYAGGASTSRLQGAELAYHYLKRQLHNT